MALLTENPAKVLALIPARGGSKGVPGKNKKILGNKPLIAWTIQDATECSRIDRVVVSTEDAQIAAIARTWKAEIVPRPPELATDTANLQDAVDYTLNALRQEGYIPDLMVVMFPTSPFRRQGLVDHALRTVMSDPEVHAVNALVPLDFNLLDLLNADGTSYTTPETAAQLNGITYGFSMTFAVQSFAAGAVKRRGIALTADEAIDIDAPEDWAAAERALTRWM